MAVLPAIGSCFRRFAPLAPTYQGLRRSGHASVAVSLLADSLPGTVLVLPALGSCLLGLAASSATCPDFGRVGAVSPTCDFGRFAVMSPTCNDVWPVATGSPTCYGLCRLAYWPPTSSGMGRFAPLTLTAVPWYATALG